MEGTSISKRESQLITNIERRDMVVFTPTDIRRFLNLSGVNASRIIQNMNNKGLIKRVERGKYILTVTLNELDVYEIVSELFKPSYISFWSALHFHSMTDQVPRTVFLATTRRKRALRLQGQTIRYVTIKEQMFFGYERLGKVVVSDPEKTVIDCLRHPEYSGGIPQVYRALSKDLDLERLVEYCTRTGSSAIASRLGYILEKKKITFRKDDLKCMVTTYTKLDVECEPIDPDPKWKLYVNGEMK